MASLNKTSELMSKCRHAKKFLACIAVVPGWGRGYSARGSPVRELERGEWEEKGRERLPPAIVLFQYAPN